MCVLVGDAGVLKGIPPRPAGVPQILVTLEYNKSGIVHVHAREVDPKRTQSRDQVYGLDVWRRNSAGYCQGSGRKGAVIMAKGLFINFFDAVGLDPADSRAKNYEILKEKHREWAGKPSQDARINASILTRAMETFADQEKYEAFLKEVRDSQTKAQERAATERARQQQERAATERARQQQERAATERPGRGRSSGSACSSCSQAPSPS